MPEVFQEKERAMMSIDFYKCMLSAAALSICVHCTPTETPSEETTSLGPTGGATPPAVTTGDPEVPTGPGTSTGDPGVSTPSTSQAAETSTGATSDTGDSEDTGASCDELATSVQALLATDCGTCHGPDSPALGGMNYVSDLVALVAKGKVIPGDPEGSLLYSRIAKDQMPPAGVEPRPTAAEIDLVRDWIAAGACAGPSAPPCADNPLITFDEMAEEMQVDLLALDSGDRRFIRYLTLSHLYSAGACDADLEPYRQAASKLVNSLSSHSDIVPPFPIDDHATILRIDVRDYGWDDLVDVEKLNFDPWEASVAANPYAIGFSGEQVQILKQETTTQVPFQTVESFLTVTTRAPLYHDILQLPATVAALEIQLDIDAQKDLDTNEALRAGFLDSGVSAFNRMFERHVNPQHTERYYYKSFDFGDDEDTSNIFKNPVDFKAAGGELIFSLPNRLQGYMLAAADQRIDEAPIKIVKDPKQPDQVVRTAISCMSCHDRGIIPKTDEIAAFVDANKPLFSEAVRTKVQELHDPGFLAVQELDSGAFVMALKEAGVDPDAPEPIVRAWLRHEADVDLTRAAAEFGVDEAYLLQFLAKLDISLQPLASGKVSRGTFTEHFQESICLLVPGDKLQPICP
jgi:mono/diheme cytochrome c family protein